MVCHFVAQAADAKTIVTAYGNLRGRSFLSEEAPGRNGARCADTEYPCPP